VRFGTNILIAALRRPVVLAKTAATIDVLSGGRLDLGVGVGWQREEYEAAGLSYEGRGALLDHTLEVCQALWREQVASYSGHGLEFHDIHQMPKPLQPGGVPVWVSGTVNPRAMARLARFGRGWIPWGDDATDVAGGIERMRAAVRELGRDPDGIEVVGTLPPVRTPDGAFDAVAAMDGARELVTAGVTDVRVLASPPRERDAATEYLRRVVDRFHDVLA
jgi:probable F420-dependent oxidoreductase